MGLFTRDQIAKINAVAEKSKEISEFKPTGNTKVRGVNNEIQEMSQQVIDYFKDSPAILIESVTQLDEYVTKMIEAGIGGIDTETTGLDRLKDTIVGASLYYPGGVECYIPMKHLVPIFDEPYKGQLTYQDVGVQFQRFVDAGTKMIFANADFDLAMMYKDLKVDMNDICYYDVILAWRCLKEDEKDNALKVLYNKYVLKGKGDPKKFADFFTPQLFPYCKPEVAKLYAANDAKITYELFMWQLPYVTKDNPKCKKNHLEAIADLLWNVELPLIKICQNMHRTGMYLDKEVASKLVVKYAKEIEHETAVLADIVDDILQKSSYHPSPMQKVPFKTGKEFSATSTMHVKHLLYTVMGLPQGKDGAKTNKDVIAEFNLPVTNQILKVRSLNTLISTFVEKLPKATTPDSRIHGRFNQIGAATGRMSSAEPNLQNVPSHATDIRHLFRATPGYVMLSSDYSAQEPRITAFVSNDPKMIQSFKENKDIYASIASVAFKVPYEKCLEFHPETGEYQPEGKARRGEAKYIVLGICYGRSVPSIGEQLYGTRDDMTDEEKTKEAQKVFDSVMNSFPNLRALMTNSQDKARKLGYTETILGRRRHLPDMQLPEFEFRAMKNYVNPDIDPLDITTLQDRSTIPDRIVKQLTQEFAGYKYFGQIARRTRELYDEGIRVINNRQKINDATRQVVNGIIQGSAADQTKMAILELEHNQRWKEIGGRLLCPVHDELVAEVPLDYWEEGGQLLSKCMCDAASFLPFPSKCDVTTTLRWYGLDYPCQYKRPESFNGDLTCLSEDEIKWIQYHLFDLEYNFPVFNNEDGSKPRGDAALGVSGKISDELKTAVADYISKRSISAEQFLDDIEYRVIQGVYKQ